MAGKTRIEDVVLMFHAGCGGIVVGELEHLTCAECGKRMVAFVAGDESTRREIPTMGG